MSKEAMKLAHEALLDNRHYIVEHESAAYLEIYDESIAAVEKALAEQPAQRTWVGLNDTDLAVCGNEDDVLLARYWERVCREKNT